MLNKLFYIKPQQNDYPMAVCEGFWKAFQLARSKNYSNIKFVLSSSDLLLSPPNILSTGLDKLFDDWGTRMVTSFKKDRAFSIPDYPEKGKRFGINLLSVSNSPFYFEENTVVVLLWADEKSLSKIQNELALTKIDLVAVIFNPTKQLNKILSASLAENISSTDDPDVTLYQNSFSADVNAILSPLKSINITDGGHTTYVRESLKQVVTALKKAKAYVSFEDCLGFLINDVGFPLGDSLDLLNSQRKYFES